MNITLWRKPEPMLALADALEIELSELSLTPADRTKKRATSARDELLEEIEELEGENLAADGRIMGAEGIIAAEKTRKEKRLAEIAERKRLIAVLDRTKADIDALNDPQPIPSSSKRKKGMEAAPA
jgi:hypothetical protein